MRPRGPLWRVGEGWDTHALVEGRKLILGGVEIAHTHGLAGHSDADALARSPDATDESSAIEAIGLRPKLVTGSAENIKVTLPGDFAIAEALLARRAAAA